MNVESWNWVVIGDFIDIFWEGVWVVKIDVGCIVVFRIWDDEVFVLDDCCLYKGGLFSEGIVYGILVMCLLYNWVFDLVIGLVKGVDEGFVLVIVVKVDNGKVFFVVDDLVCWIVF